MSGNLAGFQALVEACDTQIAYGLTGQSLASNNPTHGTQDLGTVQAEMFQEDAMGIALELQQVVQKAVNWAVELNFDPDAIPPVFEFDMDKMASFEEIMAAIDHEVPVSKEAMYSYYKLPKPKDKEDTFLRSAQGQGFGLSDSCDRKKTPSPSDLVRQDELAKAIELDQALEPFSEKVQDVIKKTLQDYKAFLGPTEKLSNERLNEIFYPKNHGLVEAGSKVLSVSLLLGIDHVQSNLALADEDFDKPLSFAEAIDFLKGRVSMTKKEWLELEPKLRFRAFTRYWTPSLKAKTAGPGAFLKQQIT